MPFTPGGITREDLREELALYATKEDLSKGLADLETRMNAKFGQVVDELDTIKTLIMNGSKSS